MTQAIISDLVQALVSALQGNADLDGFTITDRPPSAGTMPFVRLADVAQAPWDTDTTTGTKLDITLELASRTGSFQTLHDAADAVQSIAVGPLVLTTSTAKIALASSKTQRFFHNAAQDVERASLAFTYLIDLTA